jgi:hypothetical protein
MSKKCAAWLRAFYDCEAWVVNQPSHSRVIALDSVNHKGLSQVQDILKAKFGIPSKINPRKNRDTSQSISTENSICKNSRMKLVFSIPRRSSSFNKLLIRLILGNGIFRIEKR